MPIYASAMSSVAWQALPDESDSDGEVAIMIPSNDEAASTRLLDAETASIQRRFVNL